MAGSIGPTGLVPGVASPAELDQVAATFAEQAAALVEGGVDLFVLETFRHLEEIRIAIDAARRAAPELPIIASMAFDPSETVADGSTPEQVATTLRDWGADAIGVNCGDGPQLALAIAERMRAAGLPLCVQPNAGLPRTVDGRLLYMATPEYFDVFARRIIQLGATMIGGCCGTTPDHVHWMAKSSRMLGDKHTVVVRPSARPGDRGGAGAGADARWPSAATSRRRSPPASSWSRSRSTPRPVSIRRRRWTARRCSSTAASTSSTSPTAPRAMARMSNLAFCCAPARALRDRADPARVRPRPEPPRPDGAPARRPRHRHPQPGHHHRRSAQGRRLPRRHRGLRPRLDRPAPDGGQHEPRHRSGRQAPARRPDLVPPAPPASSPAPPTSTRRSSASSARSAAGAEIVMTQPVFQHGSARERAAAHRAPRAAGAGRRAARS